MNLFHELKNFIVSIYDNKSIIFDLAKRDYQSQYTGSILGFLWVYIQPLSFIGVIYFIFTFGFKARPDNEVPFAAWLISGMIAWLFFSSNVSAGVNIIKQNGYLIKKINFQLNILPLIKLFSSFVPHTALVIAAIIIAVVSGIPLTFYLFQLIYYMFAMSLLLMGINWLTSATNIFVPDVSKLVSILVQFGFWLTPIFWNAEQLPQKYQWLLNLNPMYYIVSGYRDSIVSQIGFWQKPYETIYFWSVCLFFCILGAVVFKRLRPHFAEVV